MKKFSFLLSAFTFLILNVPDSLLLLNCVIMLFVLWEKDSNGFWVLKLLLFSPFWNTETLKIMEPALQKLPCLLSTEMTKFWSF